MLGARARVQVNCKLLTKSRADRVLSLHELCQQEEAENEDDGLGAYNVLRTLATVLESVSSQPSLFHEVCCSASVAVPVKLGCMPCIPCCTLPADLVSS